MDAESYPFLHFFLSGSLCLFLLQSGNFNTVVAGALPGDLEAEPLQMGDYHRLHISSMFFRNALTAKLLYTKQLLSALPLSRFYKMWYEPLFCLSGSFKLVPLAVTSGYILSFAYPRVEDKYRWKAPNKSSQIEGYQEDLFRYYSGTNIYFFYCGMGAS